MIIPKSVKIGDKDFIYQYSDKGMKLERDGELYDDAYDPAEFDRKYNETDIPIDGEPMDETEEKAKAYDILMGVSE